MKEMFKKFQLIRGSFLKNPYFSNKVELKLFKSLIRPNICLWTKKCLDWLKRILQQWLTRVLFLTAYNVVVAH